MTNVYHLPYRFKPRHYQRELYHAFFNEKKKRLISILHRRAGKDKMCINLLAMAARLRVGTYLYLFPELNQARRVIWQGIDRDGLKYLDHFPMELRRKTNNTEMLIELTNGSVIQLAGCDNYNSLMGTNPVGIVFSEYSLQNPMAFNYLRPILAENDGWAIFQYTPRGRNHAYDLYQLNKDDPNWFVQKLGVDDTKKNDGSPVIPHDIVESEKKAGMPDEMIKQEFYVSFDASMVGTYFGNYIEEAEDEGRIRDFDILQDFPCYTFWDIGIRDSTAIWIMQPIDDELRLIDYYENNGCGLKHYIEYLDLFRQKHNIKYAAHYAPHDINNQEWLSGKTRIQSAFEMGIRFLPVPKLSIQDGIDATRATFHRFVFHKTHCDHGINCLRFYHKEYNDKKKIYLDSPNHDWSSHGADALRYLSVAWRDKVGLTINPFHNQFYEKWNI